MNLETVQQEIQRWQPEDQDRLAAYLTIIRLKRTADHADELCRRLDDRATEGWLALDEMKKKLDS